MKKITLITLLACSFIVAGRLVTGCRRGVPVGTQSVAYQSYWNGSRISGVVSNLTGSKISYVSIQFELLDARFFPVRVVSIEDKEGIKPHDKWEFDTEAGAIGARSTRVRNLVVR